MPLPITYHQFGSTGYFQTPSNVLPSPGDPISAEWMNSLATMTQRFRLMATLQVVIPNGEYGTLHYQALRCDVFPPILQYYVQGDLASGKWQLYQPYSVDSYHVYGGIVLFNNYPIEWERVDCATAYLHNESGTSQNCLLMAYL